MSDSVRHDPALVAHAGFEPARAGEDVSRAIQHAVTNARSKPVVPDHELLRVIGRGAYGEVWLGRNILGEYRAVKVVWRREFVGEDRPFEREFEGIRRFEPVSRSHPSQLAILHVGKNEELGYFYYVMELADDSSAECGVRNAELNEVAPSESQRRSPLNPDSYVPKTLRRVLRERGALPAQECLEISLALAGALAHLHAQGLVHRDIKPSNVVFVGGVPKLADIGLVAAVDDTLSFVGTAGYIPPEGPGSPSADVFSLGKVLYEALTGRDRQEFPALPQEFASPAADSALKAQEEGLVRTPERTLIAELNQVILRACEGDCRLRYPSAQGMLDELALLNTGGSVKERRSSARRWKLARIAALTGMAVAMAASGVILAYRELILPLPLSSNPEALTLYQQAVIIGQHSDLESTLQAYTNLTEALKLDPQFIRAYYQLSELNWSAWPDHLPPHKDMMANLKWIAEKIRELAPNSAEFHIVNSEIKFLEWHHFEEALNEMELVLRLNSKLRSHGFYGWMLLRIRGDAAAARAEWQRAEHIDGSDVTIQTHLGTTYYVEHNFPRAIEEFRTAILMEPSAIPAHEYLARALEADKQYAEALKEFETVANLYNRVATEARFKVYRKALSEKGPKGMWEAMLDDEKRDPSPWYYYMAKLCARLGYTNEVFPLLDKAYDQHDGNMTCLLVDDWWDPLRDDPRFKELLKRMGFPSRISHAP